MKTIRDIEAALKYAELQIVLSTNDTKTRCFRTIISALHAELECEKNQLTCDGCEWQPKVMGITRCNRCVRFPLLSDRYEPKGEKA